MSLPMTPSAVLEYVGYSKVDESIKTLQSIINNPTLGGYHRQAISDLTKLNDIKEKNKSIVELFQSVIRMVDGGNTNVTPVGQSYGVDNNFGKSIRYRKDGQIDNRMYGNHRKSVNINGGNLTEAIITSIGQGNHTTYDIAQSIGVSTETARYTLKAMVSRNQVERYMCNLYSRQITSYINSGGGCTPNMMVVFHLPGTVPIINK